jgi:hypothetical protein
VLGGKDGPEGRGVQRFKCAALSAKLRHFLPGYLGIRAIYIPFWNVNMGNLAPLEVVGDAIGEEQACGNSMEREQAIHTRNAALQKDQSRMSVCAHVRPQTRRFPSSLAGEGGAKHRMRGLATDPETSLRTKNQELRGLSDPSSAPSGHLLPQGEKENRALFAKWAPIDWKSSFRTSQKSMVSVLFALVMR